MQIKTAAIFLLLSQFWMQCVEGRRIERNILFESQDLKVGDICFFGDGKIGKCSSIRNCTTLMDVHKRNPKICLWDGTTPVVCCPIPTVISIAKLKVNVECGRRPTDSSLILVKRQIPKIPINKFDLHHAVAGGERAQPFSWPWMVSIHSRSNTLQYLCGGCIISEVYILTAAHCFNSKSASDYAVLTTGHRRNEGIEYDVSDIIIHPGYVSGQHHDDIALMKLSRQIIFSNTVNPACLPSPNDDYTNREPTVIGWGDTSFAGRPSDVLQEAKIDVIPNDECNASYSRLSQASFPRGITKDFLCAGLSAGGKDACQGDSGGPLMLRSYPSLKWEIIGVVSFGYQCARPGYPGVYTRVANYLKWIDENTNIIVKT